MAWELRHIPPPPVPIAALEDALPEATAACPIERVWVDDDRPKIEFQRVDFPWEPGPARYRLRCRECNLAVEQSTNRDLVQRYENVPRAPYRSEMRSDDAWAAVVFLDVLCGDAEKRRHNLEVDRIERLVEDRARWSLERAGCPHARTRGAA